MLRLLLSPYRSAVARGPSGAVLAGRRSAPGSGSGINKVFRGFSEQVTVVGEPDAAADEDEDEDEVRLGWAVRVPGPRVGLGIWVQGSAVGLHRVQGGCITGAGVPRGSCWSSIAARCAGAVAETRRVA